MVTGKLYKKYDQLTNEEKNTIKSDLQFYDYQTRSKRIPQEYDNIYKIKSIKELNGIIKKLQDNNNPLTQDPVTVAIGNHQFKTVSQNPFELLKKQYYGEIKEGNTTKWLVFNPKTEEESIIVGRGTKWCTSRDDENNQWDDYIYEEITAWIFLLSGKYKYTNPAEFERLTNNQLNKICIIVEQGQCQNRINEIFKLEELPEIGRFIEDRINDNTITLNFPMLSILDSIEYITSGFSNKKNGLFLLTQYSDDELKTIIPTLTEKDQLILIRQYPHLLQSASLDLINKHDVQLQQVTRYGQQIKYIIDAGIRPIEYNVQLQQVKNYGGQIQYIINAGVQPENENEWHDVQMQQVKQNGWQIQYINNPSEKVQLQQVLQNEYQIQYIKNPNEELKLQQVSENGLQIQFITNPSEKVQLQQIKQNSDQYNYIENPTPKQTQLYKQLKGIKESTGYISKLLDVN